MVFLNLSLDMEHKDSQRFVSINGNCASSEPCRGKDELAPGETVLITEGALKADTVVRFRPNARVIGTSGVYRIQKASYPRRSRS